MFRIYSAPQPVNLRLCGPERSRKGFSLIELVIAIGIVAFALIPILGLMSVATVAHQNSSVDSVFSIMTETALQELRNYNSPIVYKNVYNFNKLASGYTGYLYFDEDGQITTDAYSTSKQGPSGLPTTSPSNTASQSTEVGVNMNGSTLSANAGNPGVPLFTPLGTASLPAGTYYTCKITTIQPTLSTGTKTSSMYIVKLSFSWPGKPATNPRIILASISNTTN